MENISAYSNREDQNFNAELTQEACSSFSSENCYQPIVFGMKLSQLASSA